MQLKLKIIKSYVISLLFTSVFVSDVNAQIAIPQLQAGVYINDTINYQSYQFAGYCDSLGAPDLTLLISSLITPFVTGVELKFVVTSCPSPPDTAFCLQTGVVNFGDTFSFPTASTQYTFSSTPYAGGISFAILLTGTPTVPFESYPCTLLTVITLADCNNSMITMDFGSPCLVSDFVGVNEPGSKSSFSMGPNPASDYFEISSVEMINEILNFTILNGFGQEIYSEDIHPGFLTKKFNTTNYPDGIYFMKVSNSRELIYSRKVVVMKQE